MAMETGTEWTTHLQSAILAANTGLKRSTRYSAFFFRFGREANSVQLLQYHNDSLLDKQNLFVYDESAEILDESDSSDYIKVLSEKRAASLIQARENIWSEQIVQKSIFDFTFYIYLINKLIELCLFCYIYSIEIKTGDEIIYRIMAKFKRLPGTNNKHKFFAPISALAVTESHAIVNDKTSKSKKIPLHISFQHIIHARTKNDSLYIQINESLNENKESDSKKLKTQHKVDQIEKHTSWTYGISAEQIRSELIKFRTSYSDHINVECSSPIYTNSYLKILIEKVFISQIYCCTAC